MTAAPEAASDIAVALAAAMRAFDARLSDADLEQIARGIDAQRKLGAQLSPKKKRLRNVDAPITIVPPPDPPA